MSINLKIHSISESNNPKMYPTPEQMTQQQKINWLINELAKEMDKEQRISDFRAGIECESDHHGYMWTDKDYPEQ